MSVEELKPPPKREPNRKFSTRLGEGNWQVIEAMKWPGAWVTDGKLRYQPVPDDRTTRVIDTAVFMKNLSTLAKFLAAE